MSRIEERLSELINEQDSVTHYNETMSQDPRGRMPLFREAIKRRNAIRVEIIEEYTELLGALELIENLRILVDNPSAWDCFSQDVSDAIRVILPDIDAAIAKARGES